MRVTVIGGTGILGRRVVPLLAAAGHEVVAPARTAAAAARLSGVPAPVGDPWDPHFLRRHLAGAEAVVMIATSIPTGPAAARPGAWRSNARIRSQLAPLVARIARDAGVRVLVQESVLFVYGDAGSRPIDEGEPLAPAPQARACLAAERAAREFRLDRGPEARSVVLRFGLFAAPDSAQTREVWAQAERGRVLVLGHPHGWLTHVHADDAAAAVALALTLRPGTYNVGAEPVTRAAWLGQLSGEVGRRVAPPPLLLRTAVPRLIPAARVLARSIRLDSGKLLAAGWAPRHGTSAEVWKHAR